MVFNFIKKTMGHENNNSSTSNITSKLESVIKDVLTKCDSHTHSITMTALSHTDESVTIDLRLDAGADPEAIHYQLGQALQPYGIKEINLNVSLPANTPIPSHKKNMTDTVDAMKQQPSATTTKGAAKKLPKVVNAAITKSASDGAANDAKQPPISKRAPSQSSLQPHPRIKHIIVIASGKGGVGKSTTTANIALALQKLGNRVGVLDADIYGPSMPSMLGVEGVKPQLENDQFVPVDAHGLAMLSIGSLLDSDHTPVAWRGPKATGALMQLFNQTNWPMLDYLVIDMPPGTGDIQLTLAQRIPVTGAVIVTTPQHIALMDAQKGIEMFNKTSIPVIGVVENMALHTCSNCGHTEAIFGTGGGESIAEEYQVPLLGQLPLATNIRLQADKGEPSVVCHAGDGDEYAQYYMYIAKNIEANIAKYAKQRNDGRIF